MCIVILSRHLKSGYVSKQLSRKALSVSVLADSKEDKLIRWLETSSFSQLFYTHWFVWWVITISIHKENNPVLMRSEVIALFMVRDGAQEGCSLTAAVFLYLLTLSTWNQSFGVEGLLEVSDGTPCSCCVSSQITSWKNYLVRNWKLLPSLNRSWLLWGKTQCFAPEKWG